MPGTHIIEVWKEGNVIATCLVEEVGDTIQDANEGIANRDCVLRLGVECDGSVRRHLGSLVGSRFIGVSAWSFEGRKVLEYKA